MRLVLSTTFTVATLAIASSMGLFAQPPAAPPAGGGGRGRGPMIGGPGTPTADGSRAVTNGGIKAAGWSGKIDDSETKAGMTISDALFEQQGKDLHVVTGPATTYWRTGETASGDYTVKASFTEPKYMNLNTHPHPYGIVVAGNDMGTGNETELYCAAYGNGNFIVRGFGPAAFQMNGRQGEANAAVHKAPGPGEEVKQDVAISVKGGKVSCLINGTEVASYDKATVVTDGKLKSTDGAYGLRFAHNTEVIVSNFSITKN